MKTGIFPSCYNPPISFFYYLKQHQEVIIDLHENFVKQTFRNRCQILSPNGVQHLSIPIVNVKSKKTTKKTTIAYFENWQKMHWRSLEAAYRSSPYFEYYEDRFYPIFMERKYEFLYELNQELLSLLIKIIGIETTISYTEKFIKTYENAVDYRTEMNSKQPFLLTFEPYIQVFSDRHAFKPNLSILDLLFNEGPNTINYLKTSIK
ncbi:MAG: hypothetical protein CVT98_04090 [Bacteroidetes bacterium HGW-Bacteroidetes-15]|nr:MAG: hypothetical protein CVT98_04090 [Bacteroidetes bacterium HGW-Bacteroidetes-15]